MKTNKIVMGALVAAIAVMGIAYAAFSTSLTINGTANIDSNWGPIYIKSCSCTGDATCTPVSNGSNSTVTGTVTADLKKPGDTATCTFTVQNDGTLIAGVPTLEVKNQAQNAVFSSNFFTVQASDGKCLAANGSGTFKVTVGYKGDVTTAPTGSETAVVVASYSQASSCAA